MISDMIMALMHTLLPEPVVPAIKMCGIEARSAEMAAPLTSRPSAKASGALALSLPNASLSSTPRRPTISIVSLGTSMPTNDWPGTGASMRSDGADSASARSFCSELICATRTFWLAHFAFGAGPIDVAGLDAVLRHRRALRHAHHFRFQAKLPQRVFDHVLLVLDLFLRDRIAGVPFQQIECGQDALTFDLGRRRLSSASSTFSGRLRGLHRMLIEDLGFDDDLLRRNNLFPDRLQPAARHRSSAVGVATVSIGRRRTSQIFKRQYHVNHGRRRPIVNATIVMIRYKKPVTARLKTGAPIVEQAPTDHAAAHALLESCATYLRKRQRRAAPAGRRRTPLRGR